jgi:repressor of nif and glnA expression
MKRSLYFEDRKEYYRRKEAGLEYQIQVATQHIYYRTFFTNFEIAESKGYVVGSLSSPLNIPFTEAKSIIRANLPNGYTAVNFYEAIENERQRKTILVLMREGEEIWETSFNV